MTRSAHEEITALKAENSRLQSAIEHFLAPYQRAKDILRQHCDTPPKHGATSQIERDLTFAATMEQAKTRTLNDALKLLAAELQQLLNLARAQQPATSEAIEAAQEAVDLITHLHTLWPDDESKN